MWITTWLNLFCGQIFSNDKDAVCRTIPILLQMFVPTGSNSFTNDEVFSGVNWLYSWEFESGMTTEKFHGLISIGLMAIMVHATSAKADDERFSVEAASWNESAACCCQANPKTLFRWSSDPFSAVDADDVPDYEEWARSRIFFVSPNSMGTQQ